VTGMESFVGGCLGGVIGVLVSHPLDTLRTRQAVDRRELRVIVKELHREGFSSFYKGIYSPCVSVGAWKVHCCHEGFVLILVW